MSVPNDPGGPVTRVVDILTVRLAPDAREWRTDVVAVEAPVHIVINGEHYATMLCTPQHKKALTMGNIVSEGLVRSVDDIEAVEVTGRDTVTVTLTPNLDLAKRMALSASFKRLILSSCGSIDYWPFAKLIDRLKVPVVETQTPVRAAVILEGVRKLNTLATTFRTTGGVHAAVLYDRNGGRVAFAEDLGRHNAVDKVIGLALLNGHAFDACFLASTGRLTGDIVLKAARVKIPIVASLAAAIDSGIEVAKRSKTTLIGFVRGTRMNVYTHPERVLL